MEKNRNNQAQGNYLNVEHNPRQPQYFLKLKIRTRFKYICCQKCVLEGPSDNLCCSYGGKILIVFCNNT